MSELYTEEYEVNFDKNILGSFGEFETSTSYDLNYIMATIDIKRLKDLKTAGSVLNFSETKFEELVQRDVDYERVENELIEKYLKKGDNKFIFFPPLLTSPMVTDADGKIINAFNEPIEVKTNKEFCITYDENFRIKFPIYNNPPQDYPFRIRTKENEELSFHNYATKFEYNSDNVDLIVIDGQHRLMALKNLYDKNPEVLNNIKIPICLFYAPEAFTPSNLSLTDSMRQLFVTINSTAKQVSGHFITLLNDENFSSFIIREFADSLKKDNLLHLIEWNERSERRISQVNKNYSISTITIINEALKEYILKGSLTERILNLKEIKSDLDNNNCSIELIDFDNNSFCITEKIKEQINIYLVYCLRLLLLTPTVYKEKVEQLNNAIKDLNEKATRNKTGSRTFKNNVFYEYREYQERFDVDAVKDIQDEFLSFFNESYKNSFYSKNVFQQAYIKAWGDLYDLLTTNNTIDIKKYTEAFIKAMEILCFNKDKNIFSYTLEYTQNIIFKNTTIKVTKSSKEQLSNLIKSTFLNNTVTKILETDPFYNEKLIKNFAQKAIKAYFSDFYRNNNKEVTRNWRGMFDSDEKIYIKLDYLEKNINFEDNEKLFNEEIENYTNKLTEKAKVIFSNKLEVNYENIGF